MGKPHAFDKQQPSHLPDREAEREPGANLAGPAIEVHRTSNATSSMPPDEKNQKPRNSPLKLTLPSRL